MPVQAAAHRSPLRLSTQLARDNVAWAAERARAQGASIMIEAVDSYDHGPYLLDMTTKAVGDPGTNELLIDMSSIAPAVARAVFDAAREVGADALDAPVSGGAVGAREETFRSWSAARMMRLNATASGLIPGLGVQAALRKPA